MKMTECICGNPDGTNHECERCRLIARINDRDAQRRADEEMLTRAHSELKAACIVLNINLDLVSQIEERLKNREKIE